MIYLGGQWPAEFRNTFFFHDIHMNKLRNERLERSGSGYKAVRNVDFLVSEDHWYRGLSPQYGPDGSVFVNDWYDKVPCHQQRDFVDRTNGRLYKIVYQGVKPVRVDLQKAGNAELVKMQLDPNDWFVRHARRILMERAAAGRSRAARGAAQGRKGRDAATACVVGAALHRRAERHHRDGNAARKIRVAARVDDPARVRRRDAVARRAR
ncbi:MAG TPA: hypothetical protein VEO95_02010 [Chthoniobacteraceae bacterium]|nr:hypothetical protein [Chthoniobacteraceae bacterium]